MKTRLAALVLLGACNTPEIGPGELGTPRLVGEIRGSAPLDMLPPVTDRDGNVYVLNGAIDLPETKVFVGQAHGGWFDSCSATKGNTEGVHFWAGTAQDRAWYWSGDALVEVSAKTGLCTHVLDRDPSTNGDLRFLAVVPWIDETPSRTHVLTMVLSPADTRPFVGVVDLGARAFVSLRTFEAATTTVLGVGADATGRRGVIVVDTGAGIEAHWMDRDGNPAGVVPLTDGAELLGPLAFAGGLSAGVTRDGRLLAFDGTQGGLSPAPFQILGVHAWAGTLWVVGLQGDAAVIAPITAPGAVGTPIAWQTSAQAGTALAAGMDILNDHVQPSAWLRWTSTESAVGAAPFVSPFHPDDHGSGVAGWLVAGPSYQVGGTPYTRVAYVPVGISYP